MPVDLYARETQISNCLNSRIAHCRRLYFCRREKRSSFHTAQYYEGISSRDRFFGIDVAPLHIDFSQLANKDSIPINGQTSKRIVFMPHTISAVPLNGTYLSTRHRLHNPHMVNAPVISPIKENDVPR